MFFTPSMGVAPICLFFGPLPLLSFERKRRVKGYHFDMFVWPAVIAALRRIKTCCIIKTEGTHNSNKMEKSFDDIYIYIYIYIKLFFNSHYML